MFMEKPPPSGRCITLLEFLALVLGEKSSSVSLHFRCRFMSPYPELLEPRPASTPHNLLAQLTLYVSKTGTLSSSYKIKGKQPLRMMTYSVNWVKKTSECLGASKGVFSMISAYGMSETPANSKKERRLKFHRKLLPRRTCITS